MTLSSTHRKLTLEEYLTYDDGTDTRYELVDGELVEMPPETRQNNAIAVKLLLEFARYLPQQLIAWNAEIEVSGRLANTRCPDLLILTPEAATALEGTSRATITREMPPPALVVEVVSPGVNNRIRDYRHKHTEYAARCIAEYWIVDPQEKQITVCQWVEGAYTDRVFQGGDRVISHIVPEFTLTPDQMFELQA
ncbi:Uma2 family endonuclease [Alkalinema sp. FACHB-956]|uniref:Uma2 family endonuclease n=1 Tax=Alkalinema sp. FACHB-956 TaxID=2692768 RepID=UPI00168244BA|nr:Uma2 family endonuclease [Alkalinema sp. FACHB-956]MBD2325494.1 Uma2 family endonuclease [Alkalinema sp. FACHB-956]